MTFEIINSSTNKVINRSNVVSANDSVSPNLWSYPKNLPEVIDSLRECYFEAEDTTSETSPNDEDTGSETNTKGSLSPS